MLFILTFGNKIQISDKQICFIPIVVIYFQGKVVNVKESQSHYSMHTMCF